MVIQRFISNRVELHIWFYERQRSIALVFFNYIYMLYSNRFLFFIHITQYFTFYKLFVSKIMQGKINFQKNLSVDRFILYSDHK